jgi:hypothetical protein
MILFAMPDAASESVIEAASGVYGLANNRHYTHLSITDGWTGCDPNRKQAKFERYGLVSTTDG